MNECAGGTLGVSCIWNLPVTQARDNSVCWQTKRWTEVYIFCPFRFTHHPALSGKCTYSLSDQAVLSSDFQLNLANKESLTDNSKERRQTH